MAYQLYKQDREVEALALIDRMVGWPERPEEAEHRFRALLGAKVAALNEISMRQVTESERGTGYEIKLLAGEAQLPSLLELRAKCLVALLERGRPGSDPDLERRAKDHLFVMRSAAPGDRGQTILAAQMLLFMGSVDEAMETISDLLAEDPDGWAHATLQLIRRAQSADQDPARMTDQALGLLEAINVSTSAGIEAEPENLSRAFKLLRASIAADAEQALAWAGMAIINTMLGNRERTVYAFEEARKCDPMEPLVVQIGRDLRERGWRG